MTIAPFLTLDSTSLPYPGNLALSPGQALAPPPTNMLLRATPSPEPDSSANNNNNHLSFEPSLNLLGPTSFLRTSIESLLHQAIRRRNLPQVRTCLDQGAGVDMPDASGSFPIHAAVGSGDPAIVRMVLQAGGNPNQPDRQGQSPLYQATTLPVLDVLLASNTPLDLCQKDFTGGTIMHHHVRNPWWCSDLFKREAVYRLLEQGSYGAAPVNTADAQGMTPFHEALTQVEANLPAMVLPLTRMLDRHADVASPFPAARFEDPTMPLEVFVLGMQTHLQMSRNAQNALDDRQWDSLHALLLRFLDLSARTVYSARLLRVFLCPTLLSISVCRLWNFLQRLVKGVADKSAADEQGRTALHDVLLGASAFAQGAGHTLGEERVTCLLKMLVREMDGETLRAGGERGQAAWQIYVRRWSGHRYFGEMMRLFADHGAGVPGQLQPQLPAAGMAPKETSWDPFLEGQAMRWAAGDHGGMETGFGWARDAGHLGRGIAVKREV